MFTAQAQANSEPAVSRDGDFADRFWYWHGVSGKRYIHSVYPADCCPPLPGAVFVAVRRHGDVREAVGVGRFSRQWDQDSAELIAMGADEVHVHLLAREERAADAVVRDLVSWLSDRYGIAA
jgi:hypothetical protein